MIKESSIYLAFSVQTICQGNQTVDEREFFFIEFQSINVEEMTELEKSPFSNSEEKEWAVIINRYQVHQVRE